MEQINGHYDVQYILGRVDVCRGAEHAHAVALQIDLTEARLTLAPISCNNNSNELR